MFNNNRLMRRKKKLKMCHIFLTQTDPMKHQYYDVSVIVCGFCPANRG